MITWILLILIFIAIRRLNQQLNDVKEIINKLIELDDSDQEDIVDENSNVMEESEVLDL